MKPTGLAKFLLHQGHRQRPPTIGAGARELVAPPGWAMGRGGAGPGPLTPSSGRAAPEPLVGAPELSKGGPPP